MKKVFLILLTSLSIQSFSQLPSFEIEPGHYVKGIPESGKPVPHRYLGESRVKYSKRVHRVIDTRMKQNKPMSWPKNPLNLILWRAVTTGYADMPKIKAYANNSLVSTVTTSEITSKVTDIVEVPMINPDDPEDVWYKTVITEFDISTITKFRIMEDWIFDYQHGDLKPRIIAIAPLYDMVSQSGFNLGEGELFWVKMDELRGILAQQEVFNPKNDAARMSYDHWFGKRMFASHIVKQSNIYDLDIAYQTDFRDNGVEAMLESDRIKNDLFVMEHDLWEY